MRILQLKIVPNLKIPAIREMDNLSESNSLTIKESKGKSYSKTKLAREHISPHGNKLSPSL
jgi:hypothetical protein